MKTRKDDSTRTITVQKTPVTVPEPFREGDTITANQAVALNQVFAENIRNNIAAQVKQALEEGKSTEQIQKEIVDPYVKDYEFGSRPGGRSKDPVEKEAESISKDMVRDALKAKGHTVSGQNATIAKEDFNKLVQQVLDQRSDVWQRAREIVEQRQSLGTQELGI